MPDKESSPTAPTKPAAPAKMTLREFVAMKKLSSWQVAALVPHIRDYARKQKLKPMHDDMAREFPADALEDVLNRALKERV